MLPRYLATSMMSLLSFRMKCIHGLRTVFFLPRSAAYYHHNCFHSDPSVKSCFLHSSYNYLRFRRSLVSSPSCLSSSSSSSDESDLRAVVSFDSHISQLRVQDIITAEEAQSIKIALSKYANDVAKTAIVNESIDVYLSTKQRRADKGGQLVRNPGLYVRSIVRKQLLEMEENVNRDQQPVGPATPNLNTTLLQPLLQNNDIGANELNENCLLELSRCSASIADDALKAYAKQRRRREMNGTTRISNPSSYVRAVLRNNIADTDPSPLMGSLKSNDINYESVSFENEPGSSAENKKADVRHLTPQSGPIQTQQILAHRMQRKEETVHNTLDRKNLADVTASSPAMTPPKVGDIKNKYTSTTEKHLDSRLENAKPDNISKLSGSQAQPKRQVTLQPNSVQMQQIPTQRMEQRKNETVDMDYVDKCLSHFAKLEESIRQISGVGPKTELAFHKLGIYTLRDLLWHFPCSFIDRSKLQTIPGVPDGQVGTFRLVVHADRVRHNTVTCSDEAGNHVDVTFFYGRSRQGMMMASTSMKNICNKDAPYMIVSGKVKHCDQKAELFNPDIVVPSDKANAVLGIEPVYALSSGLSRPKLISAIGDALDVACKLLSLLPESLPQDVLEELGWPKLADAFVIAHKPLSMADAGIDSPARQRIAFEELSMQQAQLALTRWKLKHTVGMQSEKAYPNWRDSSLVSDAVSSLPFNLTSSQMECLDEMWGDAIGDSSSGRMLRLLQGDVGSGKTVLAYLLGLGCIESSQGGGRVVALMCPTQLLALQHKLSISDFAARLQKRSSWKIHVELLTGNVVGSLREELMTRLESASGNDAFFLIGTHALTTPGIAERLKQLQATAARAMQNNTKRGLALAIIDEEQRFGVRHRQALTECAAHSLYMSATPIPRSISLAKSGLVDLSLLKSEPRPVETTIVSHESLDKVVAILGNKINAGSKCFWVLPRIVQSRDESEDDESTTKLNVIDRYKTLAETLGEERVCYIHGRMTEREREKQLARFAGPSSQAAVLVGTTVIEVGIDIPDVNILIVEDADRFGLSQLHQLRGRIGRAGSRTDLKCNCILLSAANVAKQGDSSLFRLQVLQKTNKGEEIADADFMLRGPGDMTGCLQSGLKRGFTFDPANHWNLIDAATKFGRSFLHRISKDGSGHALVQLLAEGKVASFYDQTSASSARGFALRSMMSLFGEWKSDEGNTLAAIDTLQKLDASKGRLSKDDEAVDAKIVAFAQAIVNPKESLFEFEEQLVVENRRQLSDVVLPVKPNMVALKSQAPNGTPPMENKLLNLEEDNMIFLVLDVETTGLDDKSCHVIQLAAKVLGSEDENEIFSEYILPPIKRIPEEIEKLTGITDNFLRRGGYDPALGKDRGAARDFRSVFLDFQSFCRERAKGKELVFVAHNSKFDIRMLNGELRRWRLSENAATAPALGDTFATSVDTLRLFREGKWWRANCGRRSSLPRPSSFSLPALHSYVFDEPIVNSHNAVGDIKALERLLLSVHFREWKIAATKIQAPFVKVDR